MSDILICRITKRGMSQGLWGAECFEKNQDLTTHAPFNSRDKAMTFCKDIAQAMGYEQVCIYEESHVNTWFFPKIVSAPTKKVKA